MTTSEYKKAVDQIGPRLLQFAHRQVGQLELAKDLVQDSFIVLLDKLDHVEMAKAKSFLFAVLSNKVKDHFKLLKKQTEVQDYHRIADNESRAMEDKEIVHMALSKLNERDRMLIAYRDLEGYKYDEIGEMMNLTATQVKVYLFRARKTFKSEILKLEVAL